MVAREPAARSCNTSVSFVIPGVESVRTSSERRSPDSAYAADVSVKCSHAAVAGRLPLARSEGTMAATLLLVFFALLLFRPRLAFIALALAIVVLYRGRSSNIPRPASRHVSDDTSIRVE